MADAKAVAVAEDVVLIETQQVNYFRVEVLAETPFVALTELRASVVGRHSLVIATNTIEVNYFQVEALANDDSFVPLPDLSASVVGRHTLVRAPTLIPLNTYRVEVLAETDLPPIPQARARAVFEDVVLEEIPTPAVNDYHIEALGTFAFEPEVNQFVVEILANDSTPIEVSRYQTEVLADSTDPVSFTNQKITWFFRMH